MVQAGSCQKCELSNWGDVLDANLWPDSTVGDSWSLKGSVTEGYRLCEWVTPWWGYPS